MHEELEFVIWAAMLGLVNLIWAAGAAQPQRGLAWNIGPRDEPRPLTGMAARLDRAFRNYRETFPIFAAAILACGLGEKFNHTSNVGAYLYIIGRALYLPLYAYGVPLARTVAWGVATVGILLVIVAFFQ